MGIFITKWATLLVKSLCKSSLSLRENSIDWQLYGVTFDFIYHGIYNDDMITVMNVVNMLCTIKNFKYYLIVFKCQSYLNLISADEENSV